MKQNFINRTREENQMCKYSIGDDGWLLCDGEKVPAEQVIKKLNEEGNKAYFMDKNAMQNEYVIKLFLYECMKYYSQTRDRS
jgi:hypothetical protein